MNKFLLKGTISVRIEAGSPAKIEFGITPAEGFLTPKSIGYQQATAFQEDVSKPNQSAKVIPLINESIVRCTADDSINNLLGPLLICAAQNMPVMLHLEDDSPQKVIGFQCP